MVPIVQVTSGDGDLNPKIIRGFMQIRCQKCNYPIPSGDKTCPDCGADAPQVLKLARTANYLEIIGFLTTFCGVGIIFNIAAVICGIKAIKKINQSNGFYIGKHIAKSAIIVSSIMGILSIPGLIFYGHIMFSFASRSMVSQVKAEQESIASALNKYYAVNYFYPAPDYDKNGRPIVPHALTTPVAYLPSLIFDPYNHDGKGYFGYGVDTLKGWIITSYGPDKVDGNSGVSGGSKMPYMKAWSDESLGFNLQPSPLTYDPTNGTYSAGDIWRRGP